MIQLAGVAGVVVAMTTPLATDRLTGGDQASRIALLGTLYMILIPATFILATAFTPSPRSARHGNGKILSGIREAFNSKAMRMLFAMDLTIGFQSGITGSIFVFFVGSYLQMGALTSALLLIYFASGFVFIGLWSWIARRFGKARAVVASALYNAATIPLILLVPVGNTGLVIAYLILTGFNSGAFPMIFRSMMADVLDVGEAEHGERRSGIYYALLALAGKIGLAFSVGFVFVALDFVGLIQMAKIPMKRFKAWRFCMPPLRSS